MKAISKGSLAGCLVHLDAGSTTVWPNKTFKCLRMLITGQYPAGFFGARLCRDRLTSSHPDAILVTLPTKN